MIPRIYRRLRRIALASLLAVTASATADSFCVAGGLPIYLDTEISGETTCNYGQRQVADRPPSDELCGWVDAADDDAKRVDPCDDFQSFGFATHDSCPVLGRDNSFPKKPTSKSVPLEISPAVTASGLAAAAVAMTGVKVQQFVEPFAMIEPYLQDSLTNVNRFQDWCQSLVAKADIAKRTREERSIREAIDLIAREEPIDVVTKVDVIRVPLIEVTPLDPLVGGSAFVATIDEEYMAYDWTKRDIKMATTFSVKMFPVATPRFCMRLPSDFTVNAMMEEAFRDEAARSSRTSVASVASTIKSSPDCLLGQVADQWDVVAASLPSSQTARLPQLGEALASAFVSTGRVAKMTIEAIAMRMPKSAQGPSPIGRKLLARAGVTAETEPSSEVHSSIAAATDAATDSPDSLR